MRKSPKFTRRHYVAQAKELSAIAVPSEKKLRVDACCAEYALDNPRFDAGRFREACNA